MAKKAVLVVLLVGLISILVAGGVIRTLDKTGNVAEARGEGRGGGWGQAGGSDDCDETGKAAGQEAGTYGQGYLSGDLAGTGQAQVDEWLTLDAEVVSVDAEALVLHTAAGEDVLLEGRPWSYLQEQGFRAQPGDAVQVVGFYEGDEIEVGQITNQGSGQIIAIRDETGRPMWAGRGRQR